MTPKEKGEQVIEIIGGLFIVLFFISLMIHIHLNN